MVRLNFEDAHRIWTVLVIEAGIPDDLRNRVNFLAYAVTDPQPRPIEWRLVSELGFCGRFIFDGRGLPEVRCHMESLSPERHEVLTRVNRSLAALFAERLERDTGGAPVISG